MSNLSSNKLFWSHLTDTVMAKMVSTLIWWICQNTLRFLTLTPDLLDIAMAKSYVSSMKQEYISYRQNTLQPPQKLEFYRSFKSNHTSSSYLDLTTGTAGRRALVKLRISNDKLMIEINRYNQTTKDNRHFPFCGSNPNRRRSSLSFSMSYILND